LKGPGYKKYKAIAQQPNGVCLLEMGSTLYSSLLYLPPERVPIWAIQEDIADESE
jgi:hypothetical protein